ncbi:hypothetical protein BKK81_06200 [Cupriavidus sp. USMAHM13]|uniref:hypothetical protein n=1 Tax=Cupriavidus sp. USMAHM13 TaxID=1389192 RepID=UPI0008A6B48B|nr:hypothetical protein [Cupriavidus sp. USMAHM13]AOY98899.1 hypothetical protein BKK81_06200 [Cupriavidus sp. USMAHM13]
MALTYGHWRLAATVAFCLAGALPVQYVAAQPMQAGGQPASLCDMPWFRAGTRVQMEADGEMPMSITFRLRQAAIQPGGCEASFEIHSKSAMAALKGPPVVVDQVHAVRIVPAESGSEGNVESISAVVNARARYARMFGEAAFRGRGVLDYASMALQEGKVLEGETFESALSVKIYRLATGEEVGTMRAEHASVAVGPRKVGRLQTIATALGPQKCLPISYEKRTSLGALEFAGERLESIPTVMNVTDWYCPSVFFVLRTEVRQMGKVQRVDVTAFEREEPLE